MIQPHFKSHHLNADHDALSGNNGIGRYCILPGSDGRAKQIAKHFNNVTVKEHERGHHLYLGTIQYEDLTIDVATVASGMGCPSMEIILHELLQLGGKRFLRLGTAGSLQPDYVSYGHLINVQAAVRDEDTSRCYVPIEVPAIASLEFTSAILLAAESLGLSEELHTGTVHCKSSLYAREFGIGPRGAENRAYIQQLRQFGILASEMETATLFIQSQLYDHQFMIAANNRPANRVLAGAILTVLTTEEEFTFPTSVEKGIENSIELALQTIKTIAIQEVVD